MADWVTRPRWTRRRVLQSAGLATLGTAAGAITLNAVAPRLWPQTAPVDLNDSYWAAALPAAEPALRNAIDVDVAVIGGGLTGLATAFYLRRADPSRRVALFEARACGNGASARNGAMLLTSTADRWMIASDHPELDRRIYELTVDNIARLRLLAARFGHDIELETRGAAQTLNDAGQVDEARMRARRLSEQGMPLNFWTADEVTGRGSGPGATRARSSIPRAVSCIRGSSWRYSRLRPKQSVSRSTRTRLSTRSTKGPLSR